LPYQQFTNALNRIESKSPNLILWINDQTNLLTSSYILGESWTPNNFILLSSNRQFTLMLVNGSEYTVDRPTVDFISRIEATNISATGWILYPKDYGGNSHWHLPLNDSISPLSVLPEAPITILPTFHGTLTAQIMVSANGLKGVYYRVGFICPPQ